MSAVENIRMVKSEDDLEQVNDLLGRGWVIMCMVENGLRGYPPLFILGAPAVVAEDEMQSKYQGENDEI